MNSRKFNIKPKRTEKKESVRFFIVKKKEESGHGNRLGVEDANKCKYRMESFEFDNREWKENLCLYLQENNIYKINNFVNAINDADVDLRKLSALINCAGDKSLEVAHVLADRINEFEFVPGVDCNYDVGRYIIDTSTEYELSEELEDFFNFDDFGEYFADENNGQFVDGGFLYGDKSVEEILQTNNDIKMGGI